ncbi:very short patch repair endonuclease [Arthrobacter sp. BE255]|uniref:very short patch repair endonuclease n=1 Tax=Arthrobacter sp. BE255 TaxID=2817721 RepID=UPI00285ABFB2|nr:very short patch repair endonuclease [Arthrobacter sp. BE255]MDR7161385.1 DNA mismatch endonuclease (patch repair protein) [Arthrobacter sp. BE255]
MADFMSPEQRSAHMAKIRSKNTKPEVRLRSLLHTAGYRFRLHARDLPGKPDLVFASRRKVIFVNGCFWHGHDCPVGARLPKSNTEFWAQKRKNNEVRDAAQRAKLASLGWNVFTVWECEIPSNTAAIASVIDFLGPPGRAAAAAARMRAVEKP